MANRVLAWTMEGPRFKSWFGHLTIISRYGIGLISLVDMAGYSLFVLKVPLNTNQPTSLVTLGMASGQNYSHGTRKVALYMLARRSFHNEECTYKNHILTCNQQSQGTEGKVHMIYAYISATFLAATF